VFLKAAIAASFVHAKNILGFFEADSISAVFRILILMGTAFIVLLSLDQKPILEEDTGEYFFFILCLAIII